MDLESNNKNASTELNKDEPSSTIKTSQFRQVLAICDRCNKPLYDSSEIFRYSETISHHVGRSTHYETISHILCNECNQKRLDEEKRILKVQEEQRKEDFKKKRNKSFIYSSVVALILLAIAIYAFATGSASVGGFFIVTAVLGFTFTGTMILDNTFIPDMWMEVTSWGFVKLPGIIFEFSFDGLVFLIAMKIFLFILGIFLALTAAAFATALAMVLSIFVYPYALNKNIKCLN